MSRPPRPAVAACCPGACCDSDHTIASRPYALPATVLKYGSSKVRARMSELTGLMSTHHRRPRRCEPDLLDVQQVPPVPTGYGVSSAPTDPWVVEARPARGSGDPAEKVVPLLSARGTASRYASRSTKVDPRRSSCRGRTCRCSKAPRAPMVSLAARTPWLTARAHPTSCSSARVARSRSASRRRRRSERVVSRRVWCRCRAGRCSTASPTSTATPCSRTTSRGCRSKPASRWGGRATPTSASASSASANPRPGDVVLDKLGINPTNLVEQTLGLLESRRT